MGEEAYYIPNQVSGLTRINTNTERQQPLSIIRLNNYREEINQTMIH